LRARDRPHPLGAIRCKAIFKDRKTGFAGREREANSGQLRSKPNHATAVVGKLGVQILQPSVEGTRRIVGAEHGIVRYERSHADVIANGINPVGLTRIEAEWSAEKISQYGVRNTVEVVRKRPVSIEAESQAARLRIAAISRAQRVHAELEPEPPRKHDVVFV